MVNNIYYVQFIFTSFIIQYKFIWTLKCHYLFRYLNVVNVIDDDIGDHMHDSIIQKKAFHGPEKTGKGRHNLPSAGRLMRVDINKRAWNFFVRLVSRKYV